MTSIVEERFPDTLLAIKTMVINVQISSSSSNSSNQHEKAHVKQDPEKIETWSIFRQLFREKFVRDITIWEGISAPNLISFLLEQLSTLNRRPLLEADEDRYGEVGGNSKVVIWDFVKEIQKVKTAPSFVLHFILCDVFVGVSEQSATLHDHSHSFLL